MPKVSVIVPVYGVEKYIERCATSLFEQTLDDIEFIFVDDCTPDKSIVILRSIIERYHKRIADKGYIVKIEKMPSNGGLAAVRRHGIQMASGDFIINCDSDDWVDATMYEKMYKYAIKNNSDLVFCDYYISNGDKNLDKIFRKDIKNCSREALLNRLLSSSELNPVWSAMARRELFDGMMFPVGDMSEDKTIIIQLAWKAKNATYLDEPLYYYFLSDTSILRSVNKESNIKKFKQITDNRYILLNFFEKENINISQKRLDAFVFLGKTGLIESFIEDSKTYRLWKETFPISLLKILTNPYIKVYRKIKYVQNLWKLRKLK